MHHNSSHHHITFQRSASISAIRIHTDSRILSLTWYNTVHPHPRSAFFLQTDRPEPPTPLPSGQPRPLQISPQQSFSPTSYYTWFVTPSALTTYLGSALLVLILLAGVMFPLWPPSLRLGVYYLSLGVLGLIGVFMGIAVIRLIIWVGTSLVMKRGIWWFPNLFEDVGFVSRSLSSAVTVRIARLTVSAPNFIFGYLAE